MTDQEDALPQGVTLRWQLNKGMVFLLLAHAAVWLKLFLPSAILWEELALFSHGSLSGAAWVLPVLAAFPQG